MLLFAYGPKAAGLRLGGGLRLFAFVSLALALLIWIKSPRALRALCASAGVALIALQFSESPVYGRTVLQDNRVAADPGARLVALEAPNLAITADGRRLELRDFEITAEAAALDADELAWLLDCPDGSVQIHSDFGRPTYDKCFGQASLWAFPFRRTFFPQRFPAYQRLPLGDTLWNLGLATRPDGEVAPQVVMRRARDVAVGR
jgi:hypothetical protein